MNGKGEMGLSFCYLGMTLVSLWWIGLMASFYFGKICGPG